MSFRADCSVMFTQ